MLSTLTCVLLLGQTDLFEYQPAPCDNALKGLVPYTEPADGRFPYSMEFTYLPLSKLMTDFNTFNWKPLDREIEAVAKRGRQTVFRVYLEYPKKLGAIPQFLIDAGVKTTRWKNTNTAPFPPEDCITPDYSNPKLIKALEQFIAALGQRYDNDTRVAYITAGLLGTWGEWHTYPRDDLWAPHETQQAVMQAYAKAFRNVPILLRYPTAGDSMYASTANQPYGYHDDSFAWATLETGKPDDSWFFEPSLKRAKLTEIWKTHPIGGEIRPEVWGCVFDKKPCTPKGQSFDECRDRLHVTWLMDTGLSQEQASPDRMQRAIKAVQRMGYEFHIASATIEHEESNLSITCEVRNTGIAPFYRPGWTVHAALFPAALVPAAQQAPAVTKTTDWSLLQLQPDQSRQWATTLNKNNLTPGDYLIAISIPPTFKGGPQIRFANTGQDHDINGWMTIGRVSVP